MPTVSGSPRPHARHSQQHGFGGCRPAAASEDILKIAVWEALEGPYMEVTFAQMVRKRGGWLAILSSVKMLTATAMGYFSRRNFRAVCCFVHSVNYQQRGEFRLAGDNVGDSCDGTGGDSPADWWRVIGEN